jgi:hypothetical protein
MTGADERNRNGTEPEDELVQRLRTLQWPTAPPEVRERCFQQMQERLAEMEARGELHLDPDDVASSESNGSLGDERFDGRFG